MEIVPSTRNFSSSPRPTVFTAALSCSKAGWLISASDTSPNAPFPSHRKKGPDTIMREVVPGSWRAQTGHAPLPSQASQSGPGRPACRTNLWRGKMTRLIGSPASSL
ncbi:unnamed protein product [Caenorhabditis auriculariae]|uniref:Uncharacterized protein n=1 Tax=Caenorhabditis auriculariae TaxID=2777116 RepID=A0A8S1HMY1_9PELO|nr:unnamed protein product [Caenorhabditis auriculariae]